MNAGYLGSGLLLSLQPTFYPSEAENKGATPSQYGFVFGIANLSAFVFAPIFAQLGTKIGPKYLYIFGGLFQALAVLVFGCLEYITHTGLFLALSYILRYYFRLMS